MKFQFEFDGRTYEGILDAGIDISIPFTTDPESTHAWYVEPVQINPVKMGDWEGRVQNGKGVNFNWVRFAPHAHGTHTECLGHISEQFYSINQLMERSHFVSLLISLEAEKEGEDMFVSLDNFTRTLGDNKLPEALIIRLLPNDVDKLSMDYSGTNPPYLDWRIARYLADHDVKHLILDLPSPDREQDEGELKFHHFFWNYPERPRFDSSITELAYVPNAVKDGLYLLEIQLSPFENNAAPSRPVLYPVH